LASSTGIFYLKTLAVGPAKLSSLTKISAGDPEIWKIKEFLDGMKRGRTYSGIKREILLERAGLSP
jgi:hypothetical protein